MRVLWISLMLVGSVTCEPVHPGSELSYPVWYSPPPSGGSPGPYEKPSRQSGSVATGSREFHYTGGYPLTSGAGSFYSSEAPQYSDQYQPGLPASSYSSSSFYPASNTGGFSSFGSEPFGAQSQPGFTGYSSFNPVGGSGLSFSSGPQQASQSGSSGSSSFSSSFQPTGGSGIFSSGSQQGSQSGSSGSHQQSTQGGWSSSSDGGDQEPELTSVSPEDQVFARKVRSRYSKRNYKVFHMFYTPTEPLYPQGPIFPHHGKTSGNSKGQVQEGF